MNTFFQPNRRYFCSTVNLFFRRSEGIKSKEAYQRIECVVDTRTNVTVIKEGNNSLSALWTAKYLGIPSVSLSINFSLVFFPVILSSSSQCNAFTYIYISTGSAGACSFTIKDKNRVPSVLRFYVTTFLPSFFLFFSSFFFFFYDQFQELDFPSVEIFIRAMIPRRRKGMKFVFVVDRRQKENIRSVVVCIRRGERSDRFSARSRNLLWLSIVTGLTLWGLRQPMYNFIPHLSCEHKLRNVRFVIIYPTKVL